MTAIDDGCIVAVFARAAIAGNVKTRLIPRLGPQGAARLHAALLCQALETALAAEVGRVQLWFADAADPMLMRIATKLGVELQRQSAGDLGVRMSRTFEVLLRAASRAILVGSDCPSRPPQDFCDADARLQAGDDAAFGPTEDGGYHLVALRRPQPALFAEIDWGSARVMEQTRARLQVLGLEWHELPLRWDVDRPDDLSRLLADPMLAPLAAASSSAGT